MPDDAPDAWVATKTERFIYDGWNVVLVLNVDNDTLRKYTWGLDLSGSLQGAGGIGGLLACLDDSAYWFFYDGNGNVGQVRTSAGTAAAHYEYDPYGNTRVATGAYAAANPFRFSTKWLDTELAAPAYTGAVGNTGLSYFGFRYYSPRLGRWLSRDPMEEHDGASLFTFSRNSPATLVDVLGLKTYEVGPGISVVYSGLYFGGEYRQGDVITTAQGRLTVLSDNLWPFKPGTILAKAACVMMYMSPPGSWQFYPLEPLNGVYWSEGPPRTDGYTINVRGALWVRHAASFLNQRMHPQRARMDDRFLNLIVTLIHEVDGHNVSNENDGPAFNAKWEQPVRDRWNALKNKKLPKLQLPAWPGDRAGEYMCCHRPPNEDKSVTTELESIMCGCEVEY